MRERSEALKGLWMGGRRREGEWKSGIMDVGGSGDGEGGKWEVARWRWWWSLWRCWWVMVEGGGGGDVVGIEVESSEMEVMVEALKVDVDDGGGMGGLKWINVKRNSGGKGRRRWCGGD